MFKNLKTRPKMLLSFSIPILLMIISAYVAFTNFKATVKTSNWVQHTHEVIAHGYELGKLIIDMETGERGFLIAGKEEFLEPFEASRKSWNDKIHQLVELVGDNRPQVDRIKDIDALAKKWLEVAAWPEMETRRRVRDGEASIAEVAVLIESGTGKQIIDSIREKLDQFIGVESDLIKTRKLHAAKTSSYTITVIVVGTGIAISLFVLTALLVSNAFARGLAVVVQGTRDLTGGNLSRRVAVKSGGETGQLGTAFNIMADALEKAQVQLVQVAEKLISIEDVERGRIARELHDETGSALTALIVNLQNLSEAKSSDAARAQIESVQNEAARTLENVRRMAHGLHPLALEQFGLATAVDQYARLFATRHLVKTQVRICDLAASLPDTVSKTLYRIVQEALTNVAKHADAEEVSIVIDKRENGVVLVVEDDGVGFNEETINTRESMGLGLQGIIERAALLRGTVEFEATPGTGTTLYVTIPVAGGVSAQAV